VVRLFGLAAWREVPEPGSDPRSSPPGTPLDEAAEALEGASDFYKRSRRGEQFICIVNC
jgi:hypothetical protein